MIDEGRPLFLQIAEHIETDIADGSLAEEERAPSTNELAAFYRINPATAAKGIDLLVTAGVLYKKRGIGMFVATGAREQILARRRAAFTATFVAPMLKEAANIGLSTDAIIELIRQEGAK